MSKTLPARAPEISFREEAGGFAFTVARRAAKTPAGRPLVAPGRALAEEIAAELRADPARLAGRGLDDPASAPNFRLCLTAIDVVAADPAARARTVADLAAYGETDLVCYRAARPAALAARQDALWSPLLDWLEGRYGARLAVTTAVTPVAQAPAALAAIRDAVEARDAHALAALALATRAAGSVVIGLALAEGHIDAEAAYGASTVDEAFQAETWGEDSEALTARELRRLDLRQAETYLRLLAGG